MRAPTCRLCGRPHWGTCVPAEQKAPAPKPAKPVKKAAPPKPETPTPSVARRPRGRPLDKERHLSNESQKPWIGLKMSRRSYYRLLAEGKL